MSQFIKLPSGCLLNTAIISYVKEEGSGIVIFVKDCERPTPESISMDDFLTLLQPQQSPIVSPVVDLDNLKPGAACQFTYEGQVKHGVIEHFDYTLSGVPGFKVVSDGETHFKPV